MWQLNLVCWTNEMAPVKESYVIRPADDDVMNQTLGCWIYGFWWSIPYSALASVNQMGEFHRYQSIFWHSHRWVLNQGNHVGMCFARNAFTVSGVAAMFGFGDAMAARLRGVEDPLNALAGGVLSGLFLGTLRATYGGYLTMCVYGSAFISMKRWGINEDTAGKIKFDPKARMWGNWNKEAKTGYGQYW